MGVGVIGKVLGKVHQFNLVWCQGFGSYFPFLLYLINYQIGVSIHSSYNPMTQTSYSTTSLVTLKSNMTEITVCAPARDTKSMPTPNPFLFETQSKTLSTCLLQPKEYPH